MKGKRDDYYNRDKSGSAKIAGFGMLGTLILIIYLAVTSCAYQRYHRQNFKAEKKSPLTLEKTNVNKSGRCFTLCIGIRLPQLQVSATNPR